MDCARHTLGVAALVMAAGTPIALAQDEGPADGDPVIVGEDAPKWDWFQLTRLDPSFEIFGRYRDDENRTQGQPTVRDTELLLRETLNLDGEVFIGHRNFIDLSVFAKLGIEDRWIDSQSADAEEHNTDFANLYDISALFFGASKLPFTVYTRRDQQNLDRDFSSSIVSTVTETGVRANYDSERTPTSVHIFYNENDQDDQTGVNDYSYTQFTFALQNTLRFTDNNRLETSYALDSIDETLSNNSSNSFLRNDLLMTNVIEFGADKENEARTYLRFYDQSGDFGFTSLRLEEQVRLRHSENLDSRYNLRAEQLERDGETQHLVNGSATVTHRLFDSLVTNATAGGDYFSTSEDFDSYSVFLRVSEDYTKRLGPGRLDLGLGGGVNLQRNSERGSTVSVVNDQRRFNDPSPITISQRNVEEGSVVVTGPGGIPTFVEGVDYTVEYFPDRIEIRPILGGGIVDGSTVLVDYDIGPEPASDIDTFNTNASFRYTFAEGWLRGLALYTSYRTTDHSIDAVDPDQFALDDIRNWVSGVEYRRKWFGLLAEYEDNDSTQNPFQTTRFQGLFEYPLGPGSLVSLRTDYEMTDFEQPDNHLDFLRVSARWNHRWSDALDTLARLDYRNEQDERRGDSEGVDAIASIRWRKRQTSVYVTYRATIVDSDSSNNTSHYVEFGFTRAF